MSANDLTKHPANAAKLASFPLEEGAYETAPDSKVLWGFGDWKLTVGDIRASRRAAAAPSAKLASFPLEEGAYERALDSKILWGFGDWILTVGDVRAACRALSSGAREMIAQVDDPDTAVLDAPTP